MRQASPTTRAVATDRWRSAAIVANCFFDEAGP
jgi:hypothetical protein